MASTDTEGGVEERDGVLGGAGAGVRVHVAQLLRVLDRKLDRGVDGVNVTIESVQLLVDHS